MFATDPLSLVFLGCIIFAGAFLIISSVSGFGHGLHLGAHGPHLGVHAATHAGYTAQAPHAAHASTAHTTTGTPSAGTPTQSMPAALLHEAFASGLNLYSLLIFLLIFGIAGYLLHNSTSLGVVLTLVAALLAGSGGALGTGLLLGRLFLTADGHALTSDSSRLEGRLGTVSIAIRPGGIGEVLFRGPGGSRQSVGARSLDGAAIAQGAEVVIVSYADGIASVQPWDTFMAAVRSGTAPRLEPLQLP
jgi:hypothetical protein